MMLHVAMAMTTTIQLPDPHHESALCRPMRFAERQALGKCSGSAPPSAQLHNATVTQSSAAADLRRSSGM